MQFDFDTMLDRSEVISIKWSPEELHQGSGGRDVIPMGIADMDFRVAPAVAEAMQRRAAHETYGYAYPSPEFLQACVDWQKRRNGWEIRPEWISYTPGVNPALVYAIEMWSEPGDGVILQSPVYYPYYDFVRYTGRRIVLNRLTEEDGRYGIDYDDLERLAADPKTKVLLLCSPQNPTGRCWRREELERLGRICVDNGVKIAVDEIHSDLILGPEPFVPFATVSDEFLPHCIICTSPSKTFNLAGLLISDIIIPDDGVRAAFLRKLEPYYLWPGVFGSAAQIAAYTEGEAWLEALLVYLRGNAEYMRSFLAENLPAVRFRIPEATYLGWLDFRALGLNNEALRRRMIDVAGVGTDDGPMFGLCGEGDGFQRLNFACPRARLSEALGRIAEAFPEARQG